MKPWPRITPRPAITQREFRGVNKLDAFSIRDEYATECVNFTSDGYPALKVRPGYSVLNTFGSSIMGMGVYKETELHVIGADGTWNRYVNGTWTQLATGLDVSAPYSFTNFKGNLSAISLIASNGSTPKYYDGSTVQTLSGVPAGMKYITQFADRLFGAVGNTLWASAYRMADDWTLPVDPADEAASAWNAEVESDDGETICSIQAGLDKLIICKPTATFALLGYDPTDYNVRPLTFDVGQFNDRAGLVYNGWLYQLTDKGWYKYGVGGNPDDGFSERVKTYFQGLSAANKANAAIGVYGKKLYASIGSTIIEYDTQYDTFFPWTGFSATHFAELSGSLYIGDASGRVLLLGGATDDAGQAITWKWVSKPYTASSMAQNIRFFRLWATMDLPTSSSFSTFLSGSPSTEDWVQGGATVTGSASIARKAISFASNILAPTQQIRTKFEGTGPMTLHEWAREQETFPLR